MRRLTTRALPVLALVAVLTGCGAAPAPPEGRVVSTVAELRQLFIDAGGECAEASPIVRYLSTAQAMQCEGDVELLTFVSESYRDRIAGRLQTEGRVFLVGANWIVASDDAEQLVETTGGVLVAPVRASPTPSATPSPSASS